MKEEKLKTQIAKIDLLKTEDFQIGLTEWDELNRKLIENFNKLFTTYNNGADRETLIYQH